MQREIKFRGLTIMGEWAIGLLARDAEGFYISNSAGRPFAFRVNPETIGEYTGFNDAEGNQVFEGDILKISNMNHTGYSDSGIADEPNDIFEDFNGEVFFEDAAFQVTGHPFGEIPLMSISKEDVEIIGNIHKNQELIPQ